jgi:uncharacterized protein involved in exopolysaccharide biosynthesis
MTPIDTNVEPYSAPAAADSPVEPDGGGSIDLIDVALVLAARKWRIFFFSLAVAVIVAIIVLLVKPTYTATATMLPPQEDNSSALLGRLGGLASLVNSGGGTAGLLGLKNPDDLYIGLLRSQTVADGIIHRFDLMNIYKTKRMSDTRAALKGHTTIVAEKSSLIRIDVKDHDPKRAADMANAYVSQLHGLTSHLAVTSAARRRLFFQEQVKIEKKKLADAETALEKTEEKTGIIQPQGQAQAVIATIMQLQAQISAREVELGALRASATEQNPEVIQLQSQIKGLQAQLSDFEKGHPGSAALTGKVLTPTSKVPAASLEYLRKMRDVRYRETLFELMARQYEMARVEEAREGQMIQVVDPATVPDRRSWPPRTLLVVLAFVLAVIVSSFWAVLRFFFSRKMRAPELAAKTARLNELMRKLPGQKAEPHQNE